MDERGSISLTTSPELQWINIDRTRAARGCGGRLWHSMHSYNEGEERQHIMHLKSLDNRSDGSSPMALSPAQSSEVASSTAAPLLLARRRRSPPARKLSPKLLPPSSALLCEYFRHLKWASNTRHDVHPPEKGIQVFFWGSNRLPQRPVELCIGMVDKQEVRNSNDAYSACS